MGKFNCPVVKARLTSPFGYRDIGRGKERHQGVDLASPIAGMKVPIYAAAEGEVVFAKPLSTYGNSVRIIHSIGGKTYETNYAHLDRIDVKVGQVVKQGQQIGIMGNTGGSFGVHLHFEIHDGRYAPGQPNAIDPMKWIELNTCIPYLIVNDKENDYSHALGYNAPKDSTAYRLHTTAYPTHTAALIASKDLVQRKFLAYAEIFGTEQTGFRVQSGKYTTQKAAESAAINMLEYGEATYISIIGSKD